MTSGFDVAYRKRLVELRTQNRLLERESCAVIRRLIKVVVAPEITTIEQRENAAACGRELIAQAENYTPLLDFTGCPICGAATEFSREIPPAAYWCDKCDTTEEK